MALIKCPECKKEISDKATQCIHCGCPIENKTKYYCEECGKEILETDKVCSNCGCPNSNTSSNKVEKQAKNKFLIKSIRDTTLKKFRIFYRTVGILGIIGIILFVITVIKDEYSYGYGFYYGFSIEIFLSAFVFGVIPLSIFYFCCSTIYKNSMKTYIQLNEKELYGEIYHLFRFESISFPINKISSINTIRILGFINGIMIVSNNGKPQKIFFVDNGEKFRQAIVNRVIDE